MRRHLNTNTNMTQIDCAFCSRFNCSVAAAAQTTIVTPTDDIQRLDSTTGTPSPPPSPSSFARLLLFSSLPFPATFEVPLQMCMTTVINFCLSFVFAPPYLPPLLPATLPAPQSATSAVASFCLVAQTAKAKCW